MYGYFRGSYSLDPPDGGEMILVRRRTTLWIGLTDENLNTLQTTGKLHFSLAELGADLQYDCHIVAGRDEKTIAADLGIPPENQPAKKLD